MPKQASVASAYSTKSTGRAPTITATRDSCRIKHRELVSSVTGSVAFTAATSLDINPGLSATFPWLSTMAPAWEEYRFNSLKVEYLTRTGSTTPGSMMIVPDYDPADASPLTEQIASSYEDVVEDAPWKDIVCVMPASSLNGYTKRHYVRTGSLASNLDIKTYDSAKVHLCTVDGTAVTWGKVWIEYDVELFIPALNPTGSPPFGGFITGATTQTGANPFGTAPILDASVRGVTMDAASIITFQNIGDYNLSYLLVGTVITAITAVTLGSGVTIQGAQSSIIDTGALNAQSRVRVKVTSLTNATIAFSATATTITTANVTVAMAPADSLV